MVYFVVRSFGKLSVAAKDKWEDIFRICQNLLLGDDEEASSTGDIVNGGGGSSSSSSSSSTLITSLPSVTGSGTKSKPGLIGLWRLP